LSSESSPVADSWTLAMLSVQSGFVTKRTCRVPPVSAALCEKTVSTRAAHWGMRLATWANRSGTSAA
jgi:hypothetical protein